MRFVPARDVVYARVSSNGDARAAQQSPRALVELARDRQQWPVYLIDLIAHQSGHTCGQSTRNYTEGASSRER